MWAFVKEDINYKTLILKIKSLQSTRLNFDFGPKAALNIFKGYSSKLLYLQYYQKCFNTNCYKLLKKTILNLNVARILHVCLGSECN